MDFFTLTGFLAAARLEPSSESGTPYNIEPARIPEDLTPPPPRLNDRTHIYGPPPRPPPPLCKDPPLAPPPHPNHPFHSRHGSIISEPPPP
ncbi:hypothetical protein Ancab_039428 [Ancistrocladus abbreviatus]